MEEGVVEECVRASCKQFAIKDNGSCDRSQRGINDHRAKLRSFFSLRTTRVVTRTSNTNRATVRPRWYSEIARSCGPPECIGCIGH